MFESRRAPLISPKAFFIRLVRSVSVGIFIIFLFLLLGMSGYHYFEKLSWIDAFANAAMILSGMGPLAILHTDAGKLFAGLYALFSGLAFILVIGIILAPIVHRTLHKFHLESEDK